MNIFQVAHIEVGTKCNGIGYGPCTFCYRSNDPNGTAMSLKTFTKIVSKLPNSIQSICFTLGDIDSVPDLWDMIEVAKLKARFVNLITSGYKIDEAIAKKLSRCDFVAVSVYRPKDVAYNAVKELVKAGCRVDTISLVSSQTINQCREVIEDYKTDERLQGLEKVMFYAVKNLGKNNAFRPLHKNDFSSFLEFCNDSDIPISFDSSLTELTDEAIPNLRDKKLSPKIFRERCSFNRYGIHIDIDGHVHPCSFMRLETEMTLETHSLQEIVNHPEYQKYMNNASGCPCRERCKDAAFQEAESKGIIPKKIVP